MTTATKIRHRQQAARAVVDERPLPPMPEATPFIPQKTAEALIRAAQRVAGIRLAWPVDTATVFSLGKICGYRLDRPFLSYALRKGYIKFPAKQGGHLTWELADVVALFDCCESMRRWVDGHPSHVGKLRPDERAAAEGRVRERLAKVRELCTWTVGDLAEALVRETDDEARELLCMAMRVVSGAVHVRGSGDQSPAGDPGEN